MKYAAALLLLIFSTCALADDGWYPERRRSQFQRTPGYIAIPFLFNLPGVGFGYGVLGAATNIDESCTDVSAMVFTGEVDGAAGAIDSVHILPERLILDAGGVFLRKAAVEVYADRSMSSGKDDFSIAEFRDTYYAGTRLTATFIERRAEAYLGFYQGSTKLDSIRDNDGELVVEAKGSARETVNTYVVGARADFTDDYMDPRRGVRLDTSAWYTPPESDGPDYLKLDSNLTGYVPLGSKSTLALNYFRSDALIISEGETNPARIAQEQGLDCSSLSNPADRKRCEDFIASTVAENKYGSASMLGGNQRLRAFKEGRFRASHAQSLGAELRFNITDENTPFDIYVIRDIRTAVQTALFYEIGTVSDAESEIWSATRSSYGAGLRVVTASGVVYRVDLGFGDEGFQPSIFFQYPWEL